MSFPVYPISCHISAFSQIAIGIDINIVHRNEDVTDTPVIHVKLSDGALEFWGIVVGFLTQNQAKSWEWKPFKLIAGVFR